MPRNDVALIGSNTATRLAGGGTAWNGAADCADLAADRNAPRVYMPFSGMHVLAVDDIP